MPNNKYYETSALLKKTAQALKKVLQNQDTLANAGLLINRITLETSFMPLSSMKGIRFSSKDDLFLSGQHNPSYLKMKIKIESTVKDKG